MTCSITLTYSFKYIAINYLLGRYKRNVIKKRLRKIEKRLIIAIRKTIDGAAIIVTDRSQ